MAGRATFWCVAAMALAAAVPLGANRPLIWIALSTPLIALFLLQAALVRPAPHPGDGPLVGIGALFLLGPLWGALQAAPAMRADWAAQAWAAVDGSTASISLDPAMTWQHVLRMLSYAAVFAVAARAAADARRARAAVEAVALWSAALAVYGLAALETGVNPVLGSAQAYPGSLTATFVNRNAYALYAGFGLIANLAVLAERLADRRAADPNPRRAFRRAARCLLGDGAPFVLGAVATCAALLLTQSRAGVAASAAGVAVVLAVGFWRWGLDRIAALSLATVGLAAAALGVGGFAGRVALAGLGDGNRAAIYAATLEGIAARPWLGHGLGAFEEGVRPFKGPELAAAELDFAHSVYLGLAFELGVPAAAACLAALAAIGLRLARGVALRRRNRLAPAVALATFVAAGAHGVVDFSMEIPAVAWLAALLWGVGWAQSWPSPVRGPTADAPLGADRGRPGPASRGAAARAASRRAPLSRRDCQRVMT